MFENRVLMRIFGPKRDEENEKTEGNEGKKVDNVLPYEQHFPTDIKQGHKRVRKYPVTRGNDFLWKV
jgi:hypothetical protein